MPDTFQTVYAQRVAPALLDRIRGAPYHRLCYNLGTVTSAMWAFRQAASLCSDEEESRQILAHADDFASMMGRMMDELELYTAAYRATRGGS
jgi:hypothetical protein